MTDFTREIRLRHTSIDRWSGFDLFWRDFDKPVQVQNIVDSLLEGQTDVSSARENVRRNYALYERDVQALLRIAGECKKNFTSRLYMLMEVIHAAGVASCDLGQRNAISARLAEAAGQAGKWERARQALADTMEGLQMFRRFFIDKEHLIAEIEQTLKEEWKANNRHLERSLDIFEPVTDNPSQEWIDLILWNSDSSPDSELIAQCDATIRLGIRFEDWVNRKKQKLKPVIMEISEIYRAPARTDPIDPARCLLTVADALMEARQWDLAAEIQQEVRTRVSDQNLVAFHSIIQSAYCRLKTRDLELCRKTLQDFDQPLLEKMANSDRIAAGELARFYAVQCHYKERVGRPFPPDAPQKIHGLLQQASALVNWRQGSENREAHLKNLYYSMLVRDIHSNSQRRLR